MPRKEHEPLVAVLGTRENCDGSVKSREANAANGSVSCLPTGVLSDGIAPSKSPTWKKSGMRVTIVLFGAWVNLEVLQLALNCLFCNTMVIGFLDALKSKLLGLTYNDCVSEDLGRD